MKALPVKVEPTAEGVRLSVTLRVDMSPGDMEAAWARLGSISAVVAEKMAELYAFQDVARDRLLEAGAAPESIRAWVTQSQVDDPMSALHRDTRFTRVVEGWRR